LTFKRLSEGREVGIDIALLKNNQLVLSALVPETGLH